MKKLELFFSFILLPLDFALIFLAGLSAYYLRFSSMTTELRPVIFNLPLLSFLQVLLILSSVWIIIFIFAGLYKINQSHRLRQEIKRIILGCSLGLVAIVIYIFFFDNWVIPDI